jgi:multiple sugar transport system permease protein
MRKKELLSFWILSLRMIPPIIVALPFFLMFRKIGLYDSILGLVLIYVAFNLPFVIWVLRGFVEEVPPELEEAAMIDGCSRWSILRHVTIPICLTGIVATTVLCFIFIWNEFFFALILTGVQRRTVTVGVYNFIGFAEIAWGQMCAASLLVSIPIIVFGVLVRKNLVSGLTFGALKE